MPNITIGTGSGFLSYDGTGLSFAGNTITITPGTYTGIGIFNVNGAAGNPCTIINGGAVVHTSATTSADSAFEVGTCNYLHITGTGGGGTYGFVVGVGGTACFNAHYGSRNIEIDHMECNGNGQSYGGLIFRTYPSESCQWSITGGMGPATALQMANPVWSHGYMKIHDNYIHNVTGEGMYLGCSHFGNADANGYTPNNNPLGGCSNGNEAPVDLAQIHDNLVQHTGYDGIQLSGCINGNMLIENNTIISFGEANTDGQDGGITVNPGSCGIVNRNWIQYTGTGVCMGIMWQGQGDSFVTNNIIIGGGNGQVGIAFLRNTIDNVLGSTHQNIFFENNTIVGFQTGYWWYGDNGFRTGTFWKNNIVTAPTLWSIGNGNISTLQKQTVIENTSSAFPQFVNYAGNDFHLQSSSPAKSTGTTLANVVQDYYGTGRTVPYDIGAVAFTGAPLTTTTTTTTSSTTTTSTTHATTTTTSTTRSTTTTSTTHSTTTTSTTHTTTTTSSTTTTTTTAAPTTTTTSTTHSTTTTTSTTAAPTTTTTSTTHSTTTTTTTTAAPTTTTTTSTRSTTTTSTTHSTTTTSTTHSTTTTTTTTHAPTTTTTTSSTTTTTTTRATTTTTSTTSSSTTTQKTNPTVIIPTIMVDRQDFYDQNGNLVKRVTYTTRIL